MHVRVSTIVADPATFDDGVRFYAEQMVPSIKQHRGFRGAMLDTDRASGKNLGLTFWETLADLQASEEAADGLRSQGAALAHARQAPTVERYEVAFYGVPGPAHVG